MTRKAYIVLSLATAATSPQPVFPAECISTNEWGRLRAEIMMYKRELASVGAYAFVTNTATPKTAPHIHSQCWVDWLPNEEIERKEYEQEIRNFGLDLIGELEKYAARQEAVHESNDLEKMTDELKRIAAWAKTSKGYGNCAIKQWAEGLAIGLIGKMAVDSRINTGVVEKYLAGIDSYFDDLRLRVDILNEESPHEYQMPFSDNPSDAFDNLARQWGKNRKAAIDHYSFTKFTLMKFSDAINDKREFAFYAEDPRGRYLTAREFWNRKRHWDFLGMGSDYRRVEKIKQILHFRKIAGDIPVPSLDDLSDKQLREIFKDRVNDKWQPYFRRYGQNYIGSTVISVWSGNFVDEWTRQFMWQECNLLGNATRYLSNQRN